MEKKTGQAFENGHPSYYNGKKLDRKTMIRGFTAWMCYGITLTMYAKTVDLSLPTLKKYLNQLFEDGFLPGERMKDGKIFYSDEIWGMLPPGKIADVFKARERMNE